MGENNPTEQYIDSRGNPVIFINPDELKAAIDDVKKRKDLSPAEIKLLDANVHKLEQGELTELNHVVDIIKHGEGRKSGLFSDEVAIIGMMDNALQAYIRNPQNVVSVQTGFAPKAREGDTEPAQIHADAIKNRNNNPAAAEAAQKVINDAVLQDGAQLVRLAAILVRGRDVVKDRHDVQRVPVPGTQNKGIAVTPTEASFARAYREMVEDILTGGPIRYAASNPLTKSEENDAAIRQWNQGHREKHDDTDSYHYYANKIVWFAGKPDKDAAGKSAGVSPPAQCWVDSDCLFHQALAVQSVEPLQLAVKKVREAIKGLDESGTLGKAVKLDQAARQAVEGMPNNSVVDLATKIMDLSREKRSVAWELSDGRLAIDLPPIVVEARESMFDAYEKMVRNGVNSGVDRKQMERIAKAIIAEAKNEGSPAGRTMEAEAKPGANPEAKLDTKPKTAESSSTVPMEANNTGAPAILPSPQSGDNPMLGAAKTAAQQAKGPKNSPGGQSGVKGVGR